MVTQIRTETQVAENLERIQFVFITQQFNCFQEAVRTTIWMGAIRTKLTKLTSDMVLLVTWCSTQDSIV